MDDFELYVPRPGTLPWKMLTFLLANPKAELTRSQAALQFECIASSIDALVQKAIVRECIVKKRNSQNEVVWSLGYVKNFRLDEMPPDAVASSGPVVGSPAKWTGLTKVTGPAPFPGESASPAPAPAPAPVSAAREEVRIEIRDEKKAASASPHLDTAVYVRMPLNLTPELIKAVSENPKTTFPNNADRHQSIGWLLDAWQVMTDVQRNQPFDHKNGL